MFTSKMMSFLLNTDRTRLCAHYVVTPDLNEFLQYFQFSDVLPCVLVMFPDRAVRIRESETEGGSRAGRIRPQLCLWSSGC